MFTIKRYTKDDAKVWDKYVAKARNATFLFYRNYMDYHSDRFCDHSLMFYIGNHLHSIMPGHEKGSTFCSHMGLTYGGLIMDNDVTAADTITLFRELNEYLRANGFSHVIYKPVPWVYHKIPAEEDLYPLFWVCKARITQRDVGTAIAMQQHLRWRKDRRRRLKKAQEAGIEVVQTNDFSAFWEILKENLMTNHGVTPVHSVEEMNLLKSRFPDNIIQYNAVLNNEVVAGMTFYITDQVIHGQYCSASPFGKEIGAINAIYDRVMYHDYPSHMYLDFGRSTEGDGSILNEGLVAQKEGFGGRCICYDIYEWELM